MWKKSLTMFSVTPEAAASIWLSAVDMVAARIPARITPAINAAKKPWVLIKSAIVMMILSPSLRLSIEPFALMALPTIPIKMATNIANTTHTVAILRESTNFFSSLMDMKRTRI